MNRRNRKSVFLWATVSGIFAFCALAAHFFGPLLGVSYKVAYLVAMIAASALMSGLVAFERYRLRRRVEVMTQAERLELSLMSPDIRYAIPSRRSISPGFVTLFGSVTINGMVLPLVAGPIAFLQYVLEIHDALWSALSLALGFVLAWFWWSVGVTIWRSWAMRNGMTFDEVQWRGENATLLWPRGHFWERTELGNLLIRRKVGK